MKPIWFHGAKNDTEKKLPNVKKQKIAGRLAAEATTASTCVKETRHSLIEAAWQVSLPQKVPTLFHRHGPGVREYPDNSLMVVLKQCRHKKHGKSPAVWFARVVGRKVGQSPASAYTLWFANRTASDLPFKENPAL